MRPRFANLKIVIRETVNISASSSAVIARPVLSIRSASDIGSVELLLGLHDSIYLPNWIYVRGNCRNYIAHFYFFFPLYSYSGPVTSRCR
jgi:hypothetical protein